MNRERPGRWNEEDAMLPLWRKRTDQHGRAYKKSQLQAQLYVNRRQCALTEAVLNALPSLAKLRPSLLWTSPLEGEKFAEYHDGPFLKAIGRPKLKAALANFWPSGGPRWDALAGAVAAEPITAVPRHIALA